MKKNAERVHMLVIIIIIIAEMAVFNVAGYVVEERRRWPVITASPRGQCTRLASETCCDDDATDMRCTLHNAYRVQTILSLCNQTAVCNQYRY